MSHVVSIVNLKDVKIGLEHKLRLAETSMHARSTNSRRTQSKLRDQITAIDRAIEALTADLVRQVDAAKPQVKSYTTVSLYCHADAVEDTQKQLKEKGYCWTLNRYPNFTNEYREYQFDVMAIVNFSTGKVEPQ